MTRPVGKLIGVILPFVATVAGHSAVQAEYMSLRKEQYEAAVAAARVGLSTFAALVNQTNFRQMGFESVDQVKSATLGVPVQEFTLRLDELQRYQPGGDARALLNATDRLTFPVLVGDMAKSSIVMQLTDGKWQAVSYGAPRYIAMLSQVRGRLAASDNRPTTDYFEVRAPALNVVLLGQETGGQIMLTPIVDDPRLGLKSGERKPSAQVLGILAAAAREHNGLPS